MKRIIVLLLFILLACCACSTEKEDGKKLSDLEFTVVKEEDIPKELKTIIDNKKQQVFKITYEDQDQLYIATGYGVQQTGGYSIQVKNLYLSENAIYFDTELKGPKKGEVDNQAHSYPYIVVRTEHRKESVVFQ